MRYQGKHDDRLARIGGDLGDEFLGLRNGTLSESIAAAGVADLMSKDAFIDGVELAKESWPFGNDQAQ